MKALFTGFVNLIKRVFQAIEDLLDANRADKLVFAAFVVAILRQMGVNGHFVGYDPASNWDWFQPAEVLSGIAMALLIGVALAFIARRWRRLRPQGWTEWVYWLVLSVGMLLILIAEIFYVSLYAYAAQRGSLVSVVFTPGWNMMWNISVAGVLPLMAILVGMVSDDEECDKDEELNDQHSLTVQEDALLTLIEMVKSGNAKVTPRELSREARIDTTIADKVIREAHQLGILK